ncbi:T9SS type A sorting domain-containing protein [candidate division WOR-3 bacterium]|nr:T9SS type A sorting domain-containing protein [candidate division WOR-3 bacterium]
MDYYPIIYDCCCVNGDIKVSAEVMVEAWIRDSDGGGVGSLGATQGVWPSLYWSNHFPTDLFKASFDLDIYRVGWIVNYAKNCELAENNDFASMNALMYNWFGDPELSIWTCSSQCITMNVNHPINIATGPQIFTVTVLNPENVQGAMVCLYKPESPELWQTKYTNSSGQAVFSINPRFGGTMYVTVTKHNYRPYEGECMIWPGGDGPQSTDSLMSLPAAFTLKQNTPNPFARIINIHYDIPSKGGNQHIFIRVYDVNGRLVRTLVNQLQNAGYYIVTWDGHDDNDIEVANGIYFIRFDSASYRATKKLLLLK